MRFFDNSDIISECFLYHRNANSHPWTVLQPTHGKQTNICETRVAYTFVPKSYHENANNTFWKYFTYSNKKIESEDAKSELRRVYYIYTANRRATYTINNSELNWPFPDKYSTKIRISVRRFTFTFPNLSNSLKNILQPSPGLINKEAGTEQTTFVPTQYPFSPD